jgi:transposase
MPPSSDGFVKPERRKPPSSGRRRGKQPRAPGSGLALVEHPDEVVDEFPAACGGCGSGIAGAVSVGFSRRQCHDIPPVSVVVTETCWHKVRCRCGRVTAAAVPDDVPDAPCYGPRLRALAAYLVVYQHVPVERAAQLIADVTGAVPSTGWIAAVTAQAAGLVTPSLDLIRALLVLQDVICADETATRVKDKPSWLHVACTGTLTLLGLAPRSRRGADSLGVLPGFTGIMVHDALPQAPLSGVKRQVRPGIDLVDTGPFVFHRVSLWTTRLHCRRHTRVTARPMAAPSKNGDRHDAEAEWTRQCVALLGPCWRSAKMQVHAHPGCLIDGPIVGQSPWLAID